MNYNFTDTEFSEVSEAIASMTGLHFPVERRDMLSRALTPAAKEFGFHNMGTFIKWLVSTNLSKNQIEILASFLTISETYFWREPHVFDAFSQNVIMELVNSGKNGNKSISVWCAACSTGEEAYSIAIAIYRAIPELKNWKVTILATDINPKSLAKARAGIYNSYSFRNSPAWLKNNYFKKISDKEYEVIPKIREMVTFSGFNLINGNYPATICNNSKMDVIFCRNTIMYFTDEWAEKVSQNLFDSIMSGGWLIVASCELSSQLFPRLISVNFPGAVLYRRGKKKIQAETFSPGYPSGQFSQNSLSSLIHVEDGERIINMKEADPGLVISEAYSDNFSSGLYERLYEDILTVPLTPETKEEALNKTKNSIRLLAGKGYLNEALMECEQAIASYKLVPGLYYLKASILQEQENRNGAIKSLKQAIYLDPYYIMGHFKLGNLFVQQGIVQSAERYFRNALELLNTLSNDDLPAESEGLSAKYIKAIILKSMQTQLML